MSERATPVKENDTIDSIRVAYEAIATGDEHTVTQHARAAREAGHNPDHRDTALVLIDMVADLIGPLSGGTTRHGPRTHPERTHHDPDFDRLLTEVRESGPFPVAGLFPCFAVLMIHT